MHHKPRPHYVNILMNGHNPEHQHKKDSHHRGTSNVHHHMKHEDRNTSNHTGNHHVKPCDILMREHHFHGGIASEAPHFSRGGKTSKHRRFAEGGHVDDESVEHKSKGGRTRHHHAFGGPMGPYGGIKRNDLVLSPEMREALHNPPHPNQIKSQYYGKPSLTQNQSEPFRRKKGGSCYSEGGETKDYGEKPLTGQLRKGGRATRRHHHFEGESVADNSEIQERRKGGSAKRQHHYWGQSVIGRLPLIGGIANSIANTAGTLDPNKYGGSEYTARTKGQKAADIFSTIGNLGANIALSKGGGKKKEGGGVHHKYRHHHAAGGAGKVRKGMMTESGRMIHNDD